MANRSKNHYFYALLMIASATGLGEFLDPLIGYRSVGFVYLLAVICIGVIGNRAELVVAAATCGLCWDYLFIPPRFLFTIGSLEDVLMVTTFFLVAIMTGVLTNQIRKHEMIHREREAHTKILYEILQDMAFAGKKSDFLIKVTQRVGRLFDAECGVLLKTSQGELGPQAKGHDAILRDEKDQSLAQWCFKNSAAAGWSTETLPQASSLFLPLQGLAESVGVFVLRPRVTVRPLNLERSALLHSIVGQLGFSLERHFLNKRLAETERLRDSENLHQTLLSSVSHEIRTPLTAILGSVQALELDSAVAQSSRALQLVSGLHEAGERLNRVIENLLDMSRLQSGVLSLNLEWHDFNDLLGVVIEKLKTPLSTHRIHIDFINKPLLIKVDFRLMEHAISNVVLNAVLYTPKDTEIKILLEVLTKESGDRFLVSIQDQGPGIEEGSLAKVFDKFYRVPGSPTGGTGLGLSIAKSIVELHRGVLTVRNLRPGGACFTIDLPLETQPDYPREVKT